MMILNMNLEVFGKMVDALTEERNLHFGRACVRLMNPELLDDCLFLRFSNSHIPRSFSLFPSLVASISTTALRDCKAAHAAPDRSVRAFSVSPYRQLW
jgi:hypothetical protein